MKLHQLRVTEVAYFYPAVFGHTGQPLFSFEAILKTLNLWCGGWNEKWELFPTSFFLHLKIYFNCDLERLMFFFLSSQQKCPVR